MGLFACRAENEDGDESFGSFWNLCMTNKPILQCIIVLRAWFVCHRLYGVATKAEFTQKVPRNSIKFWALSGLLKAETESSQDFEKV